MKTIEEKCLEFVLRWYRPGRLDTKRAFQRFIDEQALRVVSSSPFLSVRRLWQTVAVIAVVCLSAGLYRYLNPEEKWVVLASSGEMAEYVLPDRTQVTLAPYTSVRYDEKAFGEDKERHVELRGKAFFQVTHDEKHPFRVCDSRACVTVLGTEFQVSAGTETTKVWVESGKVLFTAVARKEGIVLTEGMSAILEREGTVPRLSHPQTENQLAWKTGYLVYDNVPVSVVLRELSRFYRTDLSTVPTEKCLSGRFSTESLDEIIEIIEHTLDIKIIKK